MRLKRVIDGEQHWKGDLSSVKVFAHITTRGTIDISIINSYGAVGTDHQLAGHVPGQPTYHPILPRHLTSKVAFPPGGMDVSFGFSQVKAGLWSWSQSSSYACSGASSPSDAAACASRAVESSNDSLMKSTGVDDEFSNTKRIVVLLE